MYAYVVPFICESYISSDVSTNTVCFEKFGNDLFLDKFAIVYTLYPTPFPGVLFYF